MKPPLQEEEQEEVTQDKRTARSPSELSESPSPRREGEEGGRRLKRWRRLRPLLLLLLQSGRGEERAPGPGCSPSFHARSPEPDRCNPSTHFVARHPQPWDALRLGRGPGLSLAVAWCSRQRVSCF